MKFTSGTVFSIKEEYPPTAGCTTSEAIYHADTLSVSVFSLAAHTDISAETYAYPKLLLAVAGEAESCEDGNTRALAEGDALVTPADVPVGIRSQEGCIYTELTLAKETHMNEMMRAGEVVRLAELLPTQDNKIVNMDLAQNGILTQVKIEDYLIYTKVFREITESTNNFQHKPVIYAFEAKYYLKVEKDCKKAEQSYNKAIEFANMLNDKVLADNLIKEKELDLIDIPSI